MTSIVDVWQSINPMRNIDNDETAPWAMSIVLRVERGHEITHEDALEASAMAVAKLMCDDRSTPDGPWHDDLLTWMGGRIRKISRRARGVKWTNVLDQVQGVTVKHRTAEVFVSVPYPVSDTPAVLAELQVRGLDLPHRQSQVLPTRYALQVAVNPTVSMSTGKLMAQVGHVAQLAVCQLPAHDVKEWLQSYSVYLNPDITLFDRNPVKSVEIQDAGFTEIPANTVTCQAWVG